MPIRIAQPADDRALQELIHRATQVLRRTYQPLPGTTPTLQPTQRGPLVRLVAEEAGRIRGTVGYAIDHDTIALSRLFVDPDHLRRGIGTALVHAVGAVARSLHLASVTLATVRETGNIPFFARLGFAIVEEHVDPTIASASHPVLHDVRMRWLVT